MLLALATWVLVYLHLGAAASWITYRWFGLAEGSRLGEAVRFFVYDTPKVFLLLTLVVFAVGMVRSFITPERTRHLLAGRRTVAGNALAAIVGVITPFCSCSAVPLFIGLLEAGVPLGITLSFLISAPMVNEVALVLLVGLVGWQVAALYLLTGLFVAVTAGWIIGRLGMEHHVEAWVYQLSTQQVAEGAPAQTFCQRIDTALEAVREIVGRIWPYVIIGIGVGAGIHGYVPEATLAAIMGDQGWWSVPAATLLGVPVYANHVGIIPVVEALLGKGAAIGTVLAFMMSAVALSLPEMIILRKVLKPKLIALFIGIVASGIIMVGFLFNAIL